MELDPSSTHIGFVSSFSSAVDADQLSQLLGLMLLKELVEGTGGAATPKVLVAAAAKGDTTKVKQLITSNPRWVRTLERKRVGQLESGVKVVTL